MTQVSSIIINKPIKKKCELGHNCVFSGPFFVSCSSHRFLRTVMQIPRVVPTALQVTWLTFKLWVIINRGVEPLQLWPYNLRKVIGKS
jgi:hypothetical protein